MNEQILQFLTGPRSYLRLIAEEPQPLPNPNKYWSFIPTYTLAICPYCHTYYRAQVDTYSLFRWQQPAMAGWYIFDNYHQGKCDHFVAAFYFINLNGTTPAEREYFRNYSEVPYIYPDLLEDTEWLPGPQYRRQKISPKAIMHSLPICRITDDQFIPAYTLYTVTYYAEHPSPVLFRYYQNRANQGFEHPVIGRPKYDSWWQLQSWVNNQKLLWLNPSKPEAGIYGTPTLFPYTNINGQRREVVYRFGSAEVKRGVGR